MLYLNFDRHLICNIVAPSTLIFFLYIWWCLTYIVNTAMGDLTMPWKQLMVCGPQVENHCVRKWLLTVCPDNLNSCLWCINIHIAWSKIIRRKQLIWKKNIFHYFWGSYFSRIRFCYFITLELLSHHMRLASLINQNTFHWF